ncbi:SMP-30/gluconolactonase/LRE family protein [Luteimonas deserti]|uniref:SMP-30/gluconolactonase/LRE family protein n=1 Tax=Luteimonas deserti TaxID=2752306 RepID=A0A7Z0TYB9_9GAMM|nr:SMP-30/gluconolactonase/LRE family protein [Luteimonas deserti]NYZ62765.1 SMP-30/gluconolactonase/LRE family protein [Luteimonas deserti]
MRCFLPLSGFVVATLVSGCASVSGFPSIGRVASEEPRFERVVAADARIERLAEGFTWAEGPTWIEDGGYLLFTDVPENRMHRWSEADGLSVFMEPSGYAGPPLEVLREAGANGLFAEPSGTVLLADSGNRVLARLDPRTREKTVLAHAFDGRRFNSPNDVVRRADGAIFFTDPPYGLEAFDESPVKELPFNGVYRLDADGRVQLLDDSLSRPNGIALSPDGRTLYVANSDPERAVWMAYALDGNGAVTSRRVFADSTAEVGDDAPGLPDGMAIAADGTLFATGPGGVLVFAPDGTRLGRIETGGPVANVAFGDDGRTLYMTSNSILARVRLLIAGTSPTR